MLLVRSFVFTYPCPRNLREIIKMSLIEKELPIQIKSIWNDYHALRSQNVSTVISSSQYITLTKRLKESPLFLFPLSRESGYFFLLLQSQEKSNLFTYLEDYKKNPASAVPYFVLTLFDELVLHKGVGLVRGDVIDGLITKSEAGQLQEALLAYYSEDELYEKNVKIFNHRPEKFNFENLVQDFFARFPKPKP